MGATAGRTTINGEGLQHEDGHSHLMALTIPTCRAYDPAFGYELAVIIEEGINAMYVRGEECFYYLTVYNESYDMPAMPGEQVREGIIRGLYPFKTVKPDGAKHEVQLLGSGVILNEALRAQQTPRREVRRREHGVQRDELPDAPPRRDRVRAAQPPAPGRGRRRCRTCSRCWATRRGRSSRRATTCGRCPSRSRRTSTAGCSRWAPTGSAAARRGKALRRFFEVDAEHVAVAALYALADRGELDRAVVAKAIKELG